jgi:hypothetical protein
MQSIYRIGIALDLKTMKRAVHNRKVDPRRIAAKFLQDEVMVNIAELLP